MYNKLLHTPEGVRDIYSDEYKNKLELIKAINKCIKSYGFKAIQTPTFEFFDIFSKEVGTTPSRELYKFFDREGNTLVLRPDMTPGVARAYAKYFSTDDVVRLCYEGSVFINNSSYQGRLKESTQIGGELIGDGSIDSDSEIIALVVDVLKRSGLKEFQISIGHADIFSGLIEEAKLNEEDAENIKALILNKNFFGVDEYLENINADDALKAAFKLLYLMYQSPAEWQDKLDALKAYNKVYAAMVYLSDLYDILKLYGADKYVSFEPGLLSSYDYYTGIIFSGYTVSSGEPVVKGGRYDNLTSYFGKSAPAIGFAISLDQLLFALERGKLIKNPKSKIKNVYYSEATREAAINKALELREKGEYVEMHLLADTTSVEVVNDETNYVFI